MAFRSLEGQTLGNYQVQALLGAGGMARVYQAYHPLLNRYVAIKVMRSDLAAEPEFVRRFRHEAEAVAALRHPNIVQVFDFDVQDSLYFMVMELLDGASLQARLKALPAPPALPPAEAAGVLLDALAGLGYAHSEGVIHRDLKSANIMLTQRGQAVLTDFGVAQMLSGPRQTLTGTLLGTPHYMAPEQGLRGETSVQSDLYALGVVLYEMLTGRLPFDADTPLAILLQHAREPLPPPRAVNPAIPQPVVQVVTRVLSKEPADRYASAAEMSGALLQALHDSGLARPDRLPPLPRELWPRQVVLARPAIVSGAALTASVTEAMPQAPANLEIERLRVSRALWLGLWALVGANLIGLAVAGALGQAGIGRYVAAAWPAELFVVALGLSLLLEALAWPWLVAPVAISGSLGLLLNYYAVSRQWQNWFWWPLLVLLVAAECTLAVRWMRPAPRQRAGRLGRLASRACAALVVLSLALATLAAMV